MRKQEAIRSGRTIGGSLEEEIKPENQENPGSHPGRGLKPKNLLNFQIPPERHFISSWTTSAEKPSHWRRGAASASSELETKGPEVVEGGSVAE